MKPRRNLFRFSLRTLFVLLTLFGVWLGMQVKWVRDRREARLWIQQREFSNLHSGNGPTVSPYLNLLKPNPSGLPNYQTLVQPFIDQQYPQKPKLPWALRVLGEEPRYIILLDSSKLTRTDQEYTERLKGLFPEAQLQVQGQTPW